MKLGMCDFLGVRNHLGKVWYTPNQPVPEWHKTKVDHFPFAEPMGHVTLLMLPRENVICGCWEGENSLNFGQRKENLNLKHIKLSRKRCKMEESYYNHL